MTELNLHQLRLFCAVVDRGSLSLASRELHITQPALSIQIRRLERAAGVELLRRSAAGVTPTPAGRELHAAALQMLGQMDGIQRRMTALRSGDAGSLTIGVSHTGALYLLTRALPDFTRSHPNLDVHIQVDSAPRIFDQVLNGAMDGGIEWGPVIPPPLQAVEIASYRFGVIAAPGHSPSGRSISQKEFLSTPFITIEYGQSEPSFIDLWLMEHRMVPERITRLPSIDAVKRLVEAGLGLTILSRLSVERELQEGHLSWLTLDGFEMQRPIIFAALPGRTLAPLTRFCEFLREFTEEMSRLSPAEG